MTFAQVMERGAVTAALLLIGMLLFGWFVWLLDVRVPTPAAQCDAYHAAVTDLTESIARDQHQLDRWLVDADLVCAEARRAATASATP